MRDWPMKTNKSLLKGNSKRNNWTKRNKINLSTIQKLGKYPKFWLRNAKSKPETPKNPSKTS